MSDNVEYVNRLARMDPDELARVAEWVDKLDDHPGWQAIVTFVNETYAQQWQTIMAAHRGPSGRVLPHEEYARRLGFLAGLNEIGAVKEAFAAADERRRERDRKAAERP